jgi:hypothetical protein
VSLDPVEKWKVYDKNSQDEMALRLIKKQTIGNDHLLWNLMAYGAGITGII